MTKRELVALVETVRENGLCDRLDVCRERQPDGICDPCTLSLEALDEIKRHADTLPERAVLGITDSVWAT